MLRRWTPICWWGSWVRLLMGCILTLSRPGSRVGSHRPWGKLSTARSLGLRLFSNLSRCHLRAWTGRYTQWSGCQQWTACDWVWGDDRWPCCTVGPPKWQTEYCSYGTSWLLDSCWSKWRRCRWQLIRWQLLRSVGLSWRGCGSVSLMGFGTWLLVRPWARWWGRGR